MAQDRATLLSLNVGMPKEVAWRGNTVFTGVWKRPVDGPRMVRRLNVDGDGQGDTNGHGGEQRAVLVYQIQSYAHWQEHFGRDDFEYGQFGENLTVDGLPDDEVCIGDRYRIGEAVFEVTQPRVTCYRVGLRLGEPSMASLLVSHHRPGFYFRVITEGRVRAGDEITEVASGPGGLTVAAADALLYLPGRDVDALRTAVSIDALSPGWRQSFQELLDAAADGAGTRARPVGVEPGWAGFRPMRVSRVVAETASVSSIYLAATDGAALPRARAGQYLTVRVEGAGPGSVRSYSLSSAPGGEQYRISVKRESHGTVSGFLHDRVAETAVLDVAAPRGAFVLEPGAEPVLLVSAGIGVTPVLSMLYELADEQSRREIWWIHTARDRDRHALAAEAHELLASLPRAHEHVFYTAPGADLPDPATTHAGRLDAAAFGRLGVPADATAYLCGPESFMADVRTALTEVGLPAERVHTELFGSRERINPGLVGPERPEPHRPPGPPGTGPLVTFARSGLAVRWPSDGRSVLDLADECDVPTQWSCRTGVCHTCVTDVLSGDVDYVTEPLERPGAGEALICCSRPASDLVLDL